MLRLLKSFGWAISGIRYGLVTQTNMKIHLAMAVAVILVCTRLLDMPPLELAVVVLAIFLVLVAEMFNTAIEALVDLYSPRRHPLAKTAKDVAAGAVLLTAINAVLVAYFLIWPRIKDLMER